MSKINKYIRDKKVVEKKILGQRLRMKRYVVRERTRERERKRERERER